MSPERLNFKRILITNSSNFYILYSTQHQVSSECVYVVQPFSCSCIRYIRLSSFHIREMGINQIYFDNLNVLGACSEGVSFPPTFNDHPK